MKLRKLTLHNYCQYSDRIQEFVDGIIILRGKNGSGKSNFMNAIFFALTGDSFITKKTRSGMLKWGEDKGYVALEFEMHGSVYEIKRMLHTSGVSLKGPGVDIGKSKEATDFISQVIKADAEVLKISSFMPQSGASELVFGTKTDRQKAFSRLFNLLHLETVRTDLQKELNKIPMYPDVTPLINSLGTELALAGPQLDNLRKRQAEKAAFLADNRESYMEMASSVDKKPLDEYLEELKTLEARENEIRKQEKTLKDKIAGLPEIIIMKAEELKKHRES